MQVDSRSDEADHSPAEENSSYAAGDSPLNGCSQTPKLTALWMSERSTFYGSPTPVSPGLAVAFLCHDEWLEIGRTAA
ncbi:hypothetical protein MRX96_030924 [Rhipicephalus microplus]